jgi:hypothetical protein
MSWAFLDDHADENPKLMAVGGEAAWYWACGLCYCRRNPKVPGFIPFQKAFLLYATKNPQTIVKKLVDVGLWLETDGGFQVNDYGKIYRSDADPDEVSRKRAEAGRLGGLAKASKTLAKPRSKVPASEPGKVPEPELAKPAQDSGKILAHVRATHATRPREDPTPTPTERSDNNNQRPDRSERADVDGGGGRIGEISCPSDLKLTDDQRNTLALNLSIPPWAFDVLTTKFVASNQADTSDRRSLVVWRKCLSQAISGWWNNATTRPKKPTTVDSESIEIQ